MDFSINKPAACIRVNNKYKFISWPYGLSSVLLKTYGSSPITIVERTDDKDKGDNVSEKLRYEVENSKYLANLILSTIRPYLSDKTVLAFEGLSYGSSGNVTLQLGGYKYILMDVLSQYVPLDNMYTYAPITIKKTAGCSKKGSKKADMINAFLKENTDFSHHISNNQQSFTTKGGNWVAHLDDLVDSYWVLRTLEDRL